jgi:hypothetical protein
MKIEQFLKVVGKDWKYTSDGEYVFDKLLVSQLQEHNSWGEMMFAAVKEGTERDIHIIWAENARYWKTDGQRFTCELYVHDKVRNICYLETCLTAYNLKDLKANTRDIKKREIKRELQELYEMYPHQISVLKGEFAVPYKTIIKEKEAETELIN